EHNGLCDRRATKKTAKKTLICSSYLLYVPKLHQPENRKLEFKREFPARSNLLKTIVAFANGAGGELILGISDDDRKITGIDEPLLLEERISNLIYDAIRPSVSPYISILNVQGKEILIVQILAGNNKPYCIKSLGIEKGVYVRIGSTNRQATPDMIAELRRQSRGITFETEMDITKNVDRIYDIIKRSTGISASDIAKQMKLHHNTILRYLNQLIADGRIKKTGSGKNTIYDAM
ncbi:MAG: putative DNA binding domain-containing protein, partial [Deltaproteobacteria bacterium]|nr:putative DNA binding domain-containing protein [Deltaproteobacteria bacterium]